MEKLIAFGKKHKAWFMAIAFAVAVLVLMTLTFGEPVYNLN